MRWSHLEEEEEEEEEEECVLGVVATFRLLPGGCSSVPADEGDSLFPKLLSSDCLPAAEEEQHREGGELCLTPSLEGPVATGEDAGA